MVGIQMSFTLQIETECISFYSIERTIGIEYSVRANEHVNYTFWIHSLCNQWSITEQAASVCTLLLHFIKFKSLLEISNSRNDASGLQIVFGNLWCSLFATEGTMSGFLVAANCLVHFFRCIAKWPFCGFED